MQYSLQILLCFAVPLLLFLQTVSALEITSQFPEPFGADNDYVVSTIRYFDITWKTTSPSDPKWFSINIHCNQSIPRNPEKASFSIASDIPSSIGKFTVLLSDYKVIPGSRCVFSLEDDSGTKVYAQSVNFFVYGGDDLPTSTTTVTSTRTTEVPGVASSTKNSGNVVSAAASTASPSATTESGTASIRHSMTWAFVWVCSGVLTFSLVLNF